MDHMTWINKYYTDHHNIRWFNRKWLPPYGNFVLLGEGRRMMEDEGVGNGTRIPEEEPRRQDLRTVDRRSGHV